MFVAADLRRQSQERNLQLVGEIIEQSLVGHLFLCVVLVVLRQELPHAFVKRAFGDQDEDLAAAVVGED